jgi:hypothetical protein
MSILRRLRFYRIWPRGWVEWRYWGFRFTRLIVVDRPGFRSWCAGLTVLGVDFTGYWERCGRGVVDPLRSLANW